MAKRSVEQEPAIRKSFLVIGGVAIGAAVIGFVLMTFVFGGGGGGDDVTSPTTAPAATSAPAAGGGTAATPAPSASPSEPPGLNDGGRNPYAPIGQGGQAAAVPEAEAPAVEEAALEGPSSASLIKVLQVYGEGADLKISDAVVEGVKAGDALTPVLKVDKIAGDCVSFTENGATFEVCKAQSV